MQSLLSSSKLFCCALVAAACVSFCVSCAMAQVYQIQPNGSLMYQPRYVNPNFQQPNAVPQIYPGQIINGERVIGPAVTTPTLPRGEAVNPPKPPVANSDQANQNPSQGSQQSSQRQRSDKIPKTNLPIPAGPALKSEPDADPAPAAPDAVSNKTPENSESSLAKEENTDQSLDEMPAAASPEVKLSQEEPDAPTELSAPPASTALSAEEASSESLGSDDLLPLGPPKMETSQEDELAVDPPTIDEIDTIEGMDEIDQDILDEIKQIRAQLGGGISETLKDVDRMPSFGAIEITSAEDETGTTSQREISPEDLFNEELRSVMSAKERNRSPALATPQTTRAVQASPTTGASSQTQPQTSYDDRTEQLRTCARELEQIAGRLENIEAYEHADQLRRQAAEIWTTARQR